MPAGSVGIVVERRREQLGDQLLDHLDPRHIDLAAFVCQIERPRAQLVIDLVAEPGERVIEQARQQGREIAEVRLDERI